MPLGPSTGDQFVATLLSNILVGWVQDQAKFAATRLFPNVPVDLPQGFVPQYKLGELYRDEAQMRASGTEAETIGWSTDNAKKYNAVERAVKHLIPDPIVGATQVPYVQDRDATIIVGQKMLINREVKFVSTYLKTGLWSKDWIGANAADATHKVFWDLPGSTPIEDVTQECDRIEGTTGYRPNKLALGATVFTGLKNNPEFLDRVKYGGGPTTPALVGEQAMAQVFGVDEVVRLGGVSNTAAIGAADAISYIAPKSALLCYAAPSPSIWQPSAGYTFSWTGAPGSVGELGWRVKKYRWEILSGDFVEAQSYYDMLDINDQLATYFSVISST